MSKTASYQELKNELDTIIGELSNERTDIDEALKLYEKGQKLINELQQQLEVAKIKIEKISKQ